MEFLEVPLFDDDVFKLLVRLAIDLVFLFLLVGWAVVPNLESSQREFAFTAVLLNVVVFFICFTMKKLELDLGLALGLFAVFGVLRYRTDSIRPKQMTYLFVVIGLGVINALSNKKTSYTEIMIVNSLIFLFTYFGERMLARMFESVARDAAQMKAARSAKPSKYTIQYDRLDLLGEASRNELIADLKARTGIDTTRVDVKSIDLASGRATLSIWESPESKTPPNSDTSPDSKMPPNAETSDQS